MAEAELSSSNALCPEPAPPRAWVLWGKRSFAVTVGLFVLFTLYRLGAKFDASEVRFRFWPVALLVVCLMLANYAQAVAWQKLLERFVHRRLPGRPLYSVFMAGQLARYTPGKVALLVVRVAGVKRLGLGSHLVASSVGIDVLSWMVMGLLLGVTALAASGAELNGIGPMLSRYSAPLAGAIVLGILLLLLVDRRRFPSLLRKLFKADGEGPLLSWSVLSWQSLSWLGCVAQALLLPFAVGARWDAGVATLGVFILAPIAGFLAMVAPGGLGVREAILSFALTPSLGPSRALAVALLARGAYVLSEILSWLLARSIERATKVSA